MKEEGPGGFVLSDLCFVYGTLLRGYGNHGIMRAIGGEFVGMGISLKPFPLVVADLPYLLDYPGEGFRVRGEVYRIPKSGWEPLDRLEGHPDFYRRRAEQFQVDAETVVAWVYFLAREAPELRQLKMIRSFGEAGDVNGIT